MQQQQKTGKIYIFLEQDHSDRELISQLNLAIEMASAFEQGLSVVFISDKSLAHYGHVDQLASFEAKNEFVDFIENKVTQRIEFLKKILKSTAISGLSFIVLDKKDINNFLSEQKDKISFAILAPYKTSGLFGKKIEIPYLDAFIQEGINVFLANSINH